LRYLKVVLLLQLLVKQITSYQYKSLQSTPIDT